MNKEIAKRVLDLLDSPDHVKTLSDYAEAEIQQCYLSLEGAGTIQEVSNYQGQIAALKRLKKLRDTAVTFKGA